jgi:hypothetical protein
MDEATRCSTHSLGAPGSLGLIAVFVSTFANIGCTPSPRNNTTYKGSSSLITLPSHVGATGEPSSAPTPEGSARGASPSTALEKGRSVSASDAALGTTALDDIKEVESPLCPTVTPSCSIEPGDTLSTGSACGKLQSTFPRPRDGEDNAGPHAGLFACAEEPSGVAWGIVIQPGNRDSMEYSGSWLVVRRDSAGVKKQSNAVSYQGSSMNMNDVNAPPKCLGFYDFNGDGQQELVAVGRETINNAGAEKRVQLWTASQGKVAKYEPSRKLVAFGIADFDGDGRMDLAINPYAESSRRPTFPKSSYPTHSRYEWSLLAHAQADGSFSLDSKVSQRYAAVLCPKAPELILPQDPNLWPSHIHCAKLWGQPKKPYASQINERCANMSTPELQSVCQDGVGFLEVMLQHKLPLRLGS